MPGSLTSNASHPQAYSLYRTRLPISITHQALLLLNRLKTRYPSARGTATSPHRLFLSSLMLSSKISMDDTYSNKSWQVVGQGLFSLREVNQMERELFAFLGCVSFPREAATWTCADLLSLQMERRRTGRGAHLVDPRGRCPLRARSGSSYPGRSAQVDGGPETASRHRLARCCLRNGFDVHLALSLAGIRGLAPSPCGGRRRGPSSRLLRGLLVDQPLPSTVPKVSIPNTRSPPFIPILLSPFLLLLLLVFYRLLPNIRLRLLDPWDAGDTGIGRTPHPGSGAPPPRTSVDAGPRHVEGESRVRYAGRA